MKAKGPWALKLDTLARGIARLEAYAVFRCLELASVEGLGPPLGWRGGNLGLL